MGDGNAMLGGNTSPVSMDDLKELETTLTSSMNAQLKELREMMTQLLNGSKPPASSFLEVNASAAQSGEGEGIIKDPPPKIDGGKAEHHAVPFVYSPDPPILHPHINNRGEPPRLNPSCFYNWQFLMRSNVKSASIELWRIIEVGFKAVDPNNMTRREAVDSDRKSVV